MTKQKDEARKRTKKKMEGKQRNAINDAGGWKRRERRKEKREKANELDDEIMLVFEEIVGW
jgi:hypothetical protein